MMGAARMTIFFLFSIFFTFSVSADSAVPMKLSNDALAGKGLGEFAPWPGEMVISGNDGHTFSELFVGEIALGVYQSNPTALKITSPWPFDELVVVLSGELHLTPTGSDKTIVIKTGEMVVVPLKFTGTWEMKGDYRELFVIETKAYKKSQEPGGLLSDNDRNSFKGELQNGVRLLHRIVAN